MKAHLVSKGPFNVTQLRPGDSYELSDGHPVVCEPTGDEGSQANAAGILVINTDPKVEAAGVDTGYALSQSTMRAPDIAVGSLDRRPGWAEGCPTLAIEYAGQGQDENALQEKIRDLQRAGTELIWVVRLVGPRRVEIHKSGEAMSVALPGQTLDAGGILANPVPVEALYDRDAAYEQALQNLLQRRGFANVGALADSGRIAAQHSALRDVLEARGFTIDAATAQRIAACSDQARLSGWIRKAATSERIDDVFTAD